MLKILTIGGATQDVIIEYNAGPSCSTIETHQSEQLFACKEGSKIEVQKLHYATGGGATNAAVSFKRLGCSVSTFFKIGNDTAGQFVLNKMKEEDINTYHKIATPGQTGTSFIVPSPNKDRIIFAYRGANTTLQANDIPEDLIADQSLLYITSLSGQAAKALPYIARTAQKHIKKRGIRVAVNPGTSQLTSCVQTLKAALSDIDVLILNADEMQLLMNSLKPRFYKSNNHNLMVRGPSLLRKTVSYKTISFTLEEYFQEILSYGVKKVVVTNGKEGVYVATQDAVYFHPALEGPVANTVGAGDAFGSCFTAMLALGTTLEDAIRAGVLQAQSVIAHQDAKSGLLSSEQLEDKLSSLNKDLLQKFPTQLI